MRAENRKKRPGGRTFSFAWSFLLADTGRSGKRLLELLSKSSRNKNEESLGK